MSDKHYGYARMPRVIRKGYKNLTKLQKLLYIYLRDLCGEGGMCYRSLRTLAEETDFSTGYLSENIPLLTDAGLILAEKRKRNGKKWEIWHITIVDIWEENDKFIQAEKCSPDEQISLSQGVQEVNCSHDEQIDPSKCSPDEPNTPKVFTPAIQVRSNVNNNPYLNKKESTYVASANEQPSVSSEKIVEITPGGQLISQNLYPGRKKYKQQEIEHFNDLADIMEANGKKPVDLTLAMVQEVWQWAQTVKPYLLRDPSWKLKNIVNELPDYFANKPITSVDMPADTQEVYKPIHRKTEPLPMKMCKWMARTEREFGEQEDAGWINELEWYFQQTTCTEDEFFTSLLQAYAIAREYPEDQRMSGLFAEFKQSLSLVVDAVMVS